MNETGTPQHDPYAPPRAVQAPQQAVSDGGGYWSDGKVLVVHRDARLPELCLRCAGPPVSRVEKTLSWHHPALLALVLISPVVYLIVALIVRKTMRMELPLCDKHHRRRRTGLWLAWVGFLLALGVPFALVWSDALGNAATGLLVVSLFVLIGVGILGLFLATVVRPTKIDPTYGWFAVGKPFLDRCPPLR